MELFHAGSREGESLCMLNSGRTFSLRRRYESGTWKVRHSLSALFIISLKDTTYLILSENDRSRGTFPRGIKERNTFVEPACYPLFVLWNAFEHKMVYFCLKQRNSR